MDLLAFALLALLAGVFVIDVVHDLRGDGQGMPARAGRAATRTTDPADTAATSPAGTDATAPHPTPRAESSAPALPSL